jgi:methylmalonyl-CoA mutase, N-terminal domain
VDSEIGTPAHAEAFEDVAGDGTSNLFGGPPPQEEDLGEPEAADERRTWSGIPIKPLYTADDVPAEHLEALESPPGRPPFLRGSYEGMYRTKPWRLFQLSGYGDPEEEGERIRLLLSHGARDFTMEHDRMTADHLYDVDHPDVEARREDVGLSGAVIMSARDYALALEGIDISQCYVHAGGAVPQHAPFANSAYWTLAKRRGIDISTLRGTGQSDFFLTYVGCFPKNQIPARKALRLNADIIEFCSEHMPRWVPVSIAGYNGADTGLNAWQELGAIMANAAEYLDLVRDRGRFPIEQVAKAVGGMNVRTSMEFFEDIAKLRAARKIWHDLCVRRYGITDERVLKLRLHIVTAGSAMTYQQPLNNIIRGALMGLVAVLGGTQSLGVSGYDEAISIPTEHAHQISLRAQQILQNEMNLTSVADPLGGSYYVESLTHELEQRAWQFFDEIQEQGGFIAALDSGWLHHHAEINAYEFEREIAEGRRKIVGVNCFQGEVEGPEVHGFPGTEGVWDRAMGRLEDLRRTRDGRRAADARKALDAACRSDANVMPAMLEAMEADVTLGEVGEIYRDAFGEWDVPVKF